MPNCDATREYLGVANSTSYQDTTAPTGIQLFYRVRGFNGTTGSTVSNEANVAISPIVGVELPEDALSPALMVLGPNPAQSTTLRYAVPGNSRVRVAVFDVGGRMVARLFDGSRSKGVYDVMWSGANAQGNRVASGIYFVRLELADQASRVTRMVLIR